jgi:cytochrome c oxidase cbb3-type subunit 3
MADFTSNFWGVYITIIVLGGIVGCAWLLWANMTRRDLGPDGKPATMGHVWDDNLEEYNNPLPSWWVWLFVITIVFGLVYLALFPGLGARQGILGWSSHGQYDIEAKAAEDAYGPVFAQYAKLDLAQVAADPKAMRIGESLFLNYCSQCHASDARGSKGFPNLSDNDWLWGGAPEQIEATILGGRKNAMPPMGEIIGGGENITNMAQYVLSLSGSAHDPIKAAKAADKFAICSACHGPTGDGNPAIGAPRLNDHVWLYGGSAATIAETITGGRTNQMPAFKDFLGADKVHVLAAYVWSKSNSPAQKAEAAKAN